jgi:sugar-specific transcriptional regulator TrmB
MIENILKNIGLTEKESAVYLACLKLGSAKVSDISEIAKVNRVTAYDVLEKLMEKGFVTLVLKNNKQFFLASSPEIIADLYETKLEKFKSHIPILNSLSTIKSPLKISYYEGVDEIKKIYFDSLDSKTEILNIINEDAIQPIWSNYEEEYVIERIQKKIYLRGIAINTEKGKKLQEKDLKLYREIRLIDQSKFNFSNDIMIYDNKVAILSWPSLGGVIINNQEIAMTHRALFEMAWEFSGL